MKIYNTVIIGGGASGILAGIYLNDKNSILLEKNSILGKKMLVTGGGRCNITNNSTLNEFIKSYYNSGNYYRQAFNTFFNNDIIELLENNGCNIKVEDDNRVFPTTDESKTVVKTLTKILDKKTPYRLNSHVNSITRKDNLFIIKYNDNQIIKSKNVILATGGNTYPDTGSTGEGKIFATDLGHKNTKDTKGLAPIIIKQKWINKLQGIAINVNLEIKADKKSIVKDSGSIMFTHNGLSGFVILNNSMTIKRYLDKNKDIKIYLDFTPEYSYESLDKTLQEDFKKHPNQGLKRYLNKYIPKNMTVIFLEELNISHETILNQVTKKERVKIRDALKKTILDIKDVLEKEAMVTNSGIKQKEIDPNTCKSKIVENLYIVGELIEGCGICGGFNLQKAFSTGVLAAKSINEE